MKQVVRMSVISLLVVGMVLLLFGCDPFPQSGEGSLVLLLQSSERPLAWKPDLDMVIVSYAVSGVGPGALDSFVVGDHTEDMFTRDGLAVGDWIITVDGYNGDGARIATATVSITVRRNQTTARTAVLKPLQGIGTLTVLVEWTDNQGILNDPQVWVTVRDENGDDVGDLSVPLRLTVSGTTASVIRELAVGWYEVTVGLYEGVPGGEAKEAWQGVFTVRIVKDQTTSGIVAIPEEHIQFGSGGVSIAIQEDMDNPLTASFTIEPESVVVSSAATFTSTGVYSGTEQYRWYVDGEKQLGKTASSFSHTFPDAGRHTVSLLVADGGAMGSYGQSIVVGEHTVSFDSQGASDVLAVFVVMHGGKLAEPEEPAREGYVFGGWYKESICANRWDFATDKVSMDLILYAKWIGIMYAVGGRGPAGGWIFYDDQEDGVDDIPGYRYLEAAPAGWSGAEEDTCYIFGYYRTTPTGPNLVVGTGTSIGSGKTNTIVLVTAMGSNTYIEYSGATVTSNYAAKICMDYRGGGYEDWFLPSRDELNQMYLNLKLKGLGGFSYSNWWCSSEASLANVWNQYFVNGYQSYGAGRCNPSGVRPIRAF